MDANALGSMFRFIPESQSITEKVAFCLCCGRQFQVLGEGGRAEYLLRKRHSEDGVGQPKVIGRR